MNIQHIELQEALRNGSETVETLASKYFLKVRRHGNYPNLIQFKYDQINSPMADCLCQEARGIILDEANNWDVVARPFDKFWNLGEPLAADLNWTTARVLEKLDGSLMILYWYRDAWHVASSGTADASGPAGTAAMTFKDLFWQTFTGLGYDSTGLDQRFTYMFELMTAHNRVVVHHEKPRLVLIGARNTLTSQEIDVTTSNLRDHFEVVKAFPIKTAADILASFETLDGLQQEGYVVVDGDFQRLKIKHPRYVLFHQMLGSLTPKKLLESIRTGEIPEVIAYFPEWAGEAARIDKAYGNLIVEAMDAYKSISHIPVQKDFAAAALKTRHASAMFAVRSGKAASFNEFYRTFRLENLAEMLSLKDTEAVAA